MDYIIFIKVFSGILRKRESLSFGGRFPVLRQAFVRPVGNFQNQLRISSPSQHSFFQSVACLDLNLSCSQSL